MADVIVICDICGGHLESFADVSEEGQAPHGRWRCDKCGAVSGFWMDGGLLDLEEIRETDLNPDNRFEIFPAWPPA